MKYMGILANDLQSFRAYHPGEMVKDELAYRNISQKFFAQKLGLSYTAFNEVLNSKRPMSSELALMLEAALGINADVLVRMQTDYNMSVARKDTTIIEKIKHLRQVAAVL